MDLTAHSVALLRCPGYHSRLLLENIERIWQSSGSRQNLCSARVLIKPNLINARRGPLPCTQGAFILSAARWFVQSGSRVVVGDSPAFGTASSVLRSLGIIEELRHMGVTISDFKEVRPVMLPCGIRAKLAADALDCDLLVNLPRVKAHIQLRLTMAVKNYFGCLAGMRKSLWHMVYGGEPARFESLIIDFLKVLPGGITLMDGIVAMHRSGPMDGSPYPLQVMAGSVNPVAADRAMLEIIGLDPERSPLMAICRQQGLGGAHLGELSFPLRIPGELAVKDFLVPAVLSPVRFNPCRFAKNSIRRIVPRLAGRS